MKNEKIARIIAVVMCALALILVIGIGVGAMNTISNVATGGTGGACAHKNLKRSPQDEPLNHVNHLVLVECATCGQDMQTVYEAHDYAVGKCAVCDHACLHSAGNIVTYAYKGNGEHYVYTRCEVCRKTSTYTTAACQLDARGICEKCGIGCAHEDLIVDGDTALCNVCGKDLVHANFTFYADPDDSSSIRATGIWFAEGVTWRSLFSYPYGFDGTYTFSVGVDDTVWLIAGGGAPLGTVRLNGVIVTMDNVVIKGADYVVIK